MMSEEKFEQLVAEALDELPPFFQKAMQNVEVLVQDWPTPEELAEAGLPPGETLLGLYYGIPLTERYAYNLVTPDTITLYQGPIEAICDTPEEVRQEVRQTVIHEVAHHFGIDDDRLIELGAY